jgi:hypothetical protein
MAIFSFHTLWLWEVLSCALSITGFITLVVLLAVYDSHPIFQWHQITLNAIVSILSTTSKAWILVALREAISQWKWILFWNRSRLLKDFKLVDTASRGPWGSTKLIWDFKKRP